MYTIRKFHLHHGKNTIPLQQYAKVKHFNRTNDGYYIWVLIDLEDNEVEDCDLYIVDTEDPLDDSILDRYIGTAITKFGNYAVHLFWGKYHKAKKGTIT